MQAPLATQQWLELIPLGGAENFSEFPMRSQTKRMNYHETP
jgi:hypothetical protein